MISRAIIIALALRMSINLSAARTIIPLIDVGDVHLVQPLLMFLGLLLMVAWGLWGFRRWYFLAAFALTTFAWVTYYSVPMAFFPHVILLCLYAYLCEGKPETTRRGYAVSFFSAAFLVAGAFKMNSSFLSGAELMSGGEFVFFIPQLQLSHDVAIGLSWTAVLFEFFLAALVWWRPLLAINLALVFILGMAIIHPPVFFVYFCFLPFYFEFSLRKLTGIWESPFWWFTLMVLIRNHGGTLAEQSNVVMSALVLFSVHLYLMKESWKSSFAVIGMKGKYLLPGGIVLLTGLLRLAGAPAPLGYSMFAGGAVRENMPELRATGKTCEFLGSKIRVGRMVTDIHFQWNHSGLQSCSLKVPTVSGMHYLKRMICKFDGEFKWNYRKSGEDEFVPENCQLL